MAKGEYTPSDVPKKAIQAMDVIYQASTLMGVVGDTIKTREIDSLRFKFDVTKGVIGEYDVDLDSGIEPNKLSYTQLTADLKWSKYPYAILDSSKLASRLPNQAWKDISTSASEYFATVKDYECLSVMSAGAASSHTALGGNWDTNTAQIENDIVKGVQYIVAKSNVQPNETISVVYPADVSYELMKLDLVGNVQQQLKDYMEKSFNLSMRPYRAYLDGDGTAQMDALSDDCLIYVNGDRTCRHARYSAKAAAAKGVPLVEHTRSFDRGELYVQRQASVARVVWDGVNDANTKSNRIYKILDVT